MVPMSTAISPEVPKLSAFWAPITVKSASPKASATGSTYQGMRRGNLTIHMPMSAVAMTTQM